MPFAAILPAVIGAGASIGGAALAGSQANKALGPQNALINERLKFAQQLESQFPGAIAALQGLLPQFAQYANLGSPYYKEKQRQTFEQGVRDFGQAGGQLQQQLGERGFGFTPSGVTAGALGGLAGQQATTLSENYLRNLFQNEALQQWGLGQEANILGHIASLENPAQVLSNTPSAQIPPNYLGQGIAQAGGILSGLFSGNQGAINITDPGVFGATPGAQVNPIAPGLPAGSIPWLTPGPVSGWPVGGGSGG